MSFQRQIDAMTAACIGLYIPGSRRAKMCGPISEIRRGSDIVKALALGAKMVLVGRATLYGTACGGQAGAARAIKILSDEMERTFGYVGARSVSEIGPHIFARRDPGT